MISRTLTAREKLRRRFCYELWNVGVVEQSADDIVANGITGSVHWLDRHPPGMIMADPSCLIHADGGRTLFAEALLPRAGRGSIWSAHLAPGQDPRTAQFTPFLQSPFHMSYPFPFRGETGQALMTMETWQAGCASLLRQQNGGWQKIGQLLEGRALLDPTLWRGDDRWWLFCTFRDEGSDLRLHLFHAATLDGDWTPHPMNPVKQDFTSARPAGPLFFAGGKLIRPAQDSSTTYGGAVMLNEVRRLDEHGYEEQPLRRLQPVAGPYQWGLHTICPAGDVTLIDGKAWRFDPLEFAARAGRKAARTAAMIGTALSAGPRPEARYS
jgi:hypothetical protein